MSETGTSQLYPLLLSPQFYRRPWGTRNLAPFYDQFVDASEQPIGEAWLTGDQCRVANGPFTGAVLGDLCRRFGRDLVGTAAPHAQSFPLLIKLLFPRENLSIQVHPDDEVAARQGEPCGKTECWYVVSSDAGSRIALGLKPGTALTQFVRSIRENCAEGSLNWLEVQAGDMIYVPAGTVHALGAGSIILETQQNSDTTYRLYDYGRGRELHLERGVEAMKDVKQAGKIEPTHMERGSRLLTSPYFMVDKFALETELEFVTGNKRSADVLVALDGCGKVEAGAGAADLARGEAVIVPASLPGFRVCPRPRLEVLRMSVPDCAAGKLGESQNSETSAVHERGV